jgi:cell wall-associated NlpC family hydrolase
VGKRCETHDERFDLLRPATRLALAAATTLAVTLPLAGVASAAPEPKPTPSQAKVDRAKADVEAKKLSVAQLEAALAAATARMETASTAAEAAAERYNGAMWELDVAREHSRQAKARAHRAKADVEGQRAGIMTLVTESYQNGTELNAATALISDEGPSGLMNRYAVVQSAGDSMEARYDRFRTSLARAKLYAGRAAKAETRQTELAAEAKTLAAAAGQAAAAAGAAASQIAGQKQQLVQALAEAQNISVDLARERQAGLERIAKQKAAAAARAKEAAEQARLKKAAAEARKKAAAAKPEPASPDSSGPGESDEPLAITPAPVAAPPPVAHPAPNQSVAVRRAIAYAKQQLGRPYQWGAVGPSTFDCSGLTMRAWGAGGKSLPHYSVAQFYQSTRVSMADAKPGDLLFWSNNGSPSGIHHVALYLGGGQFLEAPHTGAYVRYNSIYSWYPDFVARP